MNPKFSKLAAVAAIFLAVSYVAFANDPGGGSNGIGPDDTLTNNGGAITLGNTLVTATIDKDSGKFTPMIYGCRQGVQSGGNV